MRLKIIVMTFGLCLALVAPVDARPIPVASMILQRQSHYKERLEFYGRVTAPKRSQLGFDIPGRIAEMHIEDGQKVSLNQVIAKLDSEKLVSRRQQLLAEKQAIQADLQLAKVNVKRFAKLLQRDHTSQFDYDVAKAKVDKLAANIARITATLATLDIDINKAVLRAPYPGIIVDHQVDVGNYVQPGQTVVTLQADIINEVQIGIPPSHLKPFPRGSCHTITIADKAYRGCVSQQVPVIDTNTNTVRVIFTLQSPTPHVAALAHIHLKNPVRQAGYWIPMDALVRAPRGLWQVYTLQKTTDPKLYRVEERLVEVIHTDEPLVYIRGNIQEGERIMKNGVFKVVPKQLVTPATSSD